MIPQRQRQIANNFNWRSRYHVHAWDSRPTGGRMRTHLFRTCGICELGLKKTPLTCRDGRFCAQPAPFFWPLLCDVLAMLNWERAEDLIAETAREAGVLIAVFGPLDAAFTDPPINRVFVAALVGIGLLFIAGGIILEAKK